MIPHHTRLWVRAYGVAINLAFWLGIAYEPLLAFVAPLTGVLLTHVGVVWVTEKIRAARTANGTHRRLRKAHA